MGLLHDGRMGRRKLGDVGRRIGLIRWSYEGEAWLPETVVGIVVKHSDGVWHVDSYGKARVLNESDWSMYQP
jgi:hypothetical protein